MKARTIAVVLLVLAGALGSGVLVSRPVQDDEKAAGATRATTRAQRYTPGAESSAASVGPEQVSALAASAARDPAQAVQHAAQLRDEQGRIEALHETLPHWLARDREAARNWLLTHVSSLPLEVGLSLVRDAAAHDVQLGLSLAQQFPAGARPRALREAYVTWAGSAPREAAKAAEQLLESDGRTRTLGEIARVWGEQAPAEALRWSLTLDTREARREALLPVVASWASHDPAATAAALASVVDEGFKQHLVDTVAVHWAGADPAAARAWVETLEPAVRAGAATALIETSLQREPERAAGWALELGGGPGSEIVEKALTSWVARDPHAALRWATLQSEQSGRAELVALASERFRLQDAPAAERWLSAHTQPPGGE
jgi:hypothetical protein